MSNLQLVGNGVSKLIKSELDSFKAAGGDAIVDNTTVGINRNLSFMKEMSEQTCVHIIAGTGYYVNDSQSEETLRLSSEEMASTLQIELTEGCQESPEVKCGIIGEIGTSWPLTDFERRAIRASAEVSSRVGAPVMFHPGRHKEAPSAIIRVFQEAGGDVTRSVMGHLDRTIHSDEELLEFAAKGSYLEYDLFGNETSVYQLNLAIDMPSDAERIRRIKVLKDEGYLNKVLMAHDIHTKHRLVGFGGHGFCHIFQNVVPVMLRRGFTTEEVNTIQISNPATWLTFTK